MMSRCPSQASWCKTVFPWLSSSSIRSKLGFSVRQSLSQSILRLKKSRSITSLCFLRGSAIDYEQIRNLTNLIRRSTQNSISLGQFKQQKRKIAGQNNSNFSISFLSLTEAGLKKFYFFIALEAGLFAICLFSKDGGDLSVDMPYKCNISVLIKLTQHPMRNPQYEEWKAFTPLLYASLAAIPLSGMQFLSRARFGLIPLQSNYQMARLKVMTAGKDKTGHGMLRIDYLAMPSQMDHNQKSPQLVSMCQLKFASRLTQMEECIPEGTRANKNKPESFLLISEANIPEVMVYSTSNLEAEAISHEQLKPRLVLMGYSGEVTALKVREQTVISGSSGGQLFMHSLRNGSTALVTYRYHREGVTDCCWIGQEEPKIASCSSEGLIYIWDSRASLPSTRIVANQGALNCLESLDNHCFLSGGKDGTVKLWDIRSTANRMYSFKEHQSAVTRIRKLKGEYQFASGCENGEVLLWEQQVEFSHLPHQRSIQDLSFNAETGLILSVDDSPVLSLWQPTR